MFKLMGKKIITILRKKLLNWPYVLLRTSATQIHWKTECRRITLAYKKILLTDLYLTVSVTLTWMLRI